MGHAVGERDLGIVNFFGALDAGVNGGAFAMHFGDFTPLEENTPFLERRPTADVNEEVEA